MKHSVSSFLQSQMNDDYDLSVYIILNCGNVLEDVMTNITSLAVFLLY